MATLIRRNPWLTAKPSATATARVFLIPYAGCGAGLYRNWPARHAAVDLVPVELPGRETRIAEPVAATFEELAAAMIEGLRPYLDVPFAFFGHCWSALAAYEATAQLQRAGGPRPAHLVVSSQVAPQDGPVGRMLGMTDPEMAEELTTTIQALGGQPHPELVRLYTDVLRADVEASRRYVVPEPLRLDCPITAVGWTEDSEVPADRMAGWNACGDTDFVLFAGRHHRFIDAPGELLRLLSAPLAAATAG
ncbi:thioesterase II family protein [Micromonospora sp. RTGN7]|uniref:thioesterase II family protein n=1 Tax=Micromonospora sp. RTGN7 TaxID=3016526 RepID=UPI0029FECD15|nr:thioesterase domain-containing protein [Micromonospora sp. RTGN7]